MKITIGRMLVVAGVVGCGALMAPAEEKNDQKAKETLVATLNKDQVKEFAVFVRVRDLRREELIVTLRLWGEKQRELQEFIKELSDEFGMTPDIAYTYDIKAKSLYQLSTNQLDKAGKPERKLIRTIKSDSEAQYISRLMVARKLTEQQLLVLAQLRAEKMQEAKLLDNKLRQTFKLDAEAGYRLDEKTGQVYRLPTSDTTEKPATSVEPMPAGHAQTSAKK